MSEATDEFKRNLKIAFDSINEGQTFTFRRTFNEGDVALYFLIYKYIDLWTTHQILFKKKQVLLSVFLA